MYKMSFEEFKAQALENIKDYLPEEYQDAKVTLETMHKLGTSYEALIVRPEGQFVTPAVDLNLFYKDYLSSGDMDMVMEGMGKHFDKKLEPFYVKARPRLENYYKSLSST